MIVLLHLNFPLSVSVLKAHLVVSSRSTFRLLVLAVIYVMIELYITNFRKLSSNVLRGLK